MSEKKNIRLLLLSLLVVLSMLLVSCGAAQDAAPSDNSQATEQVSGGDEQPADGEVTEQPADGEPTAEGAATDAQPSSGAGVVDVERSHGGGMRDGAGTPGASRGRGERLFREAGAPCVRPNASASARRDGVGIMPEVFVAASAGGSLPGDAESE